MGMAGVRQASHRWEEQEWWGGIVCVHCSTGLQGPLRGRGAWRADPPPPPDAPAEQLILGKFTRGKLCSWEMLEGVLSAARGF